MKSLKTKIAEIFTEKKNATIVTLYTQTKPLLKKGNPYKELVKLTKVNCVVNASYQKLMEKLGKQIKPRTWGKKVTNSLINYDKANYLQVNPIKAKVVYLDGKKVIPYNEVKFYLVKMNEAVSPIRVYNTNNIIGIKHAGKFLVSNNKTAEIKLLERCK